MWHMSGTCEVSLCFHFVQANQITTKRRKNSKAVHRLDGVTPRSEAAVCLGGTANPTKAHMLFHSYYKHTRYFGKETQPQEWMAIFLGSILTISTSINGSKILLPNHLKEAFPNLSFSCLFMCHPVYVEQVDKHRVCTLDITPVQKCLTWGVKWLKGKSTMCCVGLWSLVIMHITVFLSS